MDESAAQIEAVTFDFWNTICIPDDSGVRERRMDQIMSATESLGLGPVERPDLEAAMGRAWDQFQEAWKQNRQFGARDAMAVLATELGLDLDADAIEVLALGFADPGRSSAAPPLAENVEQVLIRLAASEVKIGIICDVGLTPSPALRSYLEAHGVLIHFDHWSFSDEVGVYKPAVEIFEHALDGLGGVDPSRAAHVGDLRRTDVAGAIAAGMTAVRYAGVENDERDAIDSDDGPEAHHVIDDHADLFAALGLS